jgi:hypothetical protein
MSPSIETKRLIATPISIEDYENLQCLNMDLNVAKTMGGTRSPEQAY